MINEIMNKDRYFLELMANSDKLLDHDIEECGKCYYNSLSGKIARELLESGDIKDAVKRWGDEHDKRWKESKYYKLWIDEINAGRDPRKAFEERKWLP